MFASLSSRIIIVFGIIGVGALARRQKVLSKEITEGLSRLAIEVTLPLLYFYTLSTSLTRELLFSMWHLPLFAVALTVLSFLAGRLISLGLRLNPAQKRTFWFLATFGNYGFLAIPLVFALFAEAGLVRLIVFNLGIAFLYWTLGIAILSGRQTQVKIWKNLFNNTTLALVLGLLVAACSFQLPEVILQTSRLIGDASIPLALIVVGSMLAQEERRRAGSFKVIAMLIFCRLIFIPALALLFIHTFELPGLLRVIIVLQAAMPSASTTPILINRFGADPQLGANGVFFTTLFSIITVPLFVSLALR